jgi:hypothetical protein
MYEYLMMNFLDVVIDLPPESTSGDFLDIRVAMYYVEK